MRAAKRPASLASPMSVATTTRSAVGSFARRASQRTGMAVRWSMGMRKKPRHLGGVQVEREDAVGPGGDQEIGDKGGP